MSVNLNVYLDPEPLRVRLYRPGQPDVFAAVEISDDPARVAVMITSVAEADRLIGAFVDAKQQLIAGGAS